MTRFPTLDLRGAKRRRLPARLHSHRRQGNEGRLSFPVDHRVQVQYREQQGRTGLPSTISTNRRRKLVSGFAWRGDEFSVSRRTVAKCLEEMRKFRKKYRKNRRRFCWGTGPMKICISLTFPASGSEISRTSPAKRPTRPTDQRGGATGRSYL